MANIYFNSEAEILEYGRINNLDFIEAGVENTKAEWAKYYKPFAEIEGCEVGFMVDDELHHIRYCITWKGVKMTQLNDYTNNDKTQALKLAEPFDKQGLSMTESNTNSPLQKIGKPTAQKLDEWKNWLLSMRYHDEKQRDKIFAQILAKIDECCEFFPEAKSVKWEHGYWSFEKESNGIDYVLQINSNGNIYQKTRLSYNLMDYAQSSTEIAALMMKNGLTGVNKCRSYNEAGEKRTKDLGERIRKFMGCRPF